VGVNSLIFVEANVIQANAAKYHPNVAALRALLQFWRGMRMATVFETALIG